MSNKKIKVVIIDDELRALNRIKILLNHFDDVKVVGQFTESVVGLDFIILNHPDIVFLDIEMPNKSGLEIADEIRKCCRSTKVVFVTGHGHYAIKAIKHEVFDYILKPISVDELLVTLNRLRNKIHINLSERELDIVKHISNGETSKYIGEMLHISRHTVDTHRRTILEKTGCSNTAELINYAIKIDLI